MISYVETYDYDNKCILPTIFNDNLQKSLPEGLKPSERPFLAHPV